MAKSTREYVPALGFQWLTGFYDPVIRWTIREATFKGRLLEQARVEPGHRILDLGCGTGTLALLIKRRYPGAQVIGLDADPKILEIARAKASQAGVEIVLNHGMAFDLPYVSNSVDRVVSSLLFHHLTGENKLRTLKEAFRVLRPGGELHVADWGKAQNIVMRLGFLIVQLIDGFENTADNVDGLLPEYFRAAGFEEVRETAQYTTIVGTLSLYKAQRPLLNGPQC